MLLGALEITPKLMRIDCSSSVSRLRAHATVCVRFFYIIVLTHDLVIEMRGSPKFATVVGSIRKCGVPASERIRAVRLSGTVYCHKRPCGT